MPNNQQRYGYNQGDRRYGGQQHVSVTGNETSQTMRMSRLSQQRPTYGTYGRSNSMAQRPSPYVTTKLPPRGWRKERADRKLERKREKVIRDAKYSPSETMRVQELRRLSTGNTITRYTPNKRAFDSAVLPVADIGDVRRKQRRSNAIPNVILIVCLAIALACTMALVTHLTDLTGSDNELYDVANTYTTTQAGDTSNLPPDVDFDALKALNPDVTGWIYIPGTTVNYPILTPPTEDQEFYLRRDLWKRHSVAGSIFTDALNTDGYPEEHVVIYGHHLPSNTMFTPVSNYLTDAAFMSGHRTMYVETPTVTYQLTVIGAYKVQPTETDQVNTQYASSTAFQQYLDGVVSRIQSSGNDAGGYTREDITKMFTLVTCTDNGSARSVVSCIPTSTFPTSAIPGMRAAAGATETKVTVNGIKAQKLTQPQDDVNDANGSNPLVALWDAFADWFNNLVYGIATEGDM